MALFREEDLPDRPLDAPALIAAFDGWVDAAGASSAATERLAAGGALLGTFDADILFDYRSRRPVLDVIDGTPARLTWPALELHLARTDGRDLLVLHGAEPDFRWHELGRDVLELSLRFGVVQWMSLGAIPAAVPHTRPVTVLATASAGGLLRPGQTQGPPGLLRVPSACLSALELTASGSGLPAVGFYAQVPHYVGGPFAAGTLALLRHVEQHLGVSLSLEELETEADAQRRRLDAAVEADDDVRDILQRLEQARDEEVVSGDDLAAEIERFLRTQGGEGGGTLPPRG